MTRDDHPLRDILVILSVLCGIATIVVVGIFAAHGLLIDLGSLCRTIGY